MSTIATPPTALPLGEIKVNQSNPRGEVDTESAAFAELVASIKESGVLQPVLVSAHASEGYWPLIAGHRRLAAATAAGLEEIPVLVVDVDPESNEARTAAIAENVVRENLTPLQEARALNDLRKGLGVSQIEAAEMLGKSERWARDREKLLELPGKVGEAFDTGAIASQAVGPLVEIGKQAPKVAELLAELAEQAAGEAGPQFGNKAGIPRVIGNLIRESKPAKDGKSPLGPMVDADGRIEYTTCVRVGLPHDQLKALKPRFKKIAKLMQEAGYYPGDDGGYVELEEADVDAARAFGCLLEMEGLDRWNAQTTMRWITDAAFFADRLDAAFERAEKKRKAELASRRTPRESTGSPAAKKTPEEKQAAAKAKEAEAKAKAEAMDCNLELGQMTARAFEAPKVTLEEAQLIALLFLEREGGAIAEPLAYLDKTLQGYDEKNECPTFETSGFAGSDRLDKAVEEAKSPEQVWGILLGSMVGAVLADSSVERLPSKQVAWEPPDYGDKGFAEKLLAIGKARKAIPTLLEKRLKQRRQAERDAEKRAENFKIGAVLEAIAAGKKPQTPAKVSTRTQKATAADVFTGTKGYVGAPRIAELAVTWAKRKKPLVTTADGKLAITDTGKQELEKLRDAERKAGGGK